MSLKENNNPLIQQLFRVIPPTTARLPSRGLLYKHGELDDEVVNGEVIVYPMTTLDEITIRSVDMLLQGSAIEQVFSRCIPQIKKPLELFSKDVDYLLIFLRKVSYGTDLVITYECPFCSAVNKDGKETEKHEYKISIDYFLKKSIELEDNYLDNYKITLSNQQIINLRPSKYNEILKMFSLDEDTKKPEEIREIINTSIISVIQDVNGIDEKELIIEWLNALPVSLMREIVSKLTSANNFGPEFTYKITCNDCKKDQDISYILNPVSFFTLPSSPEIKNV